MRKRYHILYQLILPLLLSLVVRLHAQPTFWVQTFNIRDGLAANFISSMDQAADGMIWVSTWNGLSYYDGYQFATFRDQKGIGETLSSNRIIRICTDANGSVWCVTFDRRLYRFDTHACRYFDVDEMIRAKYGITIPVRNIYVLPKGVSWITADRDQHSIVRIDDKQPKDADGIELIKIDSVRQDRNFVHRIVEDHDGREWILTDQYVMLYGATLRMMGRYEFVQQLGKRVYMATPDGRLGYWQKGQGGLKPVALPVTAKAITCTETIGDSRLLVGSDKGLMAIDGRGSVSLLCEQSVKHVFVDSRRRVWIVSTDGSIGLADGGNWKVPCDMAARHPVILLEDGRQTVWAVTDALTAYYYDEDKATFQRAVIENEQKRAVASQQIERFFIDGQHNLWFSTRRDLSVMRFRHQRLNYVETTTNDEIRALAADDQKRLWTGGSDGRISVFDSLSHRQGFLMPSGKLTQQPVPFSSSKIYALTFDRQHRLWVGTRGDGLYSVDMSRGTVHHYVSGGEEGLNCADIYAVDEDAYGRLWVGTYGGGLQRVEMSPEGKVRFLNSSNGGLKGFDGAVFNKVRRITHDPRGRVLVSTTSGLLIGEVKTPQSPVVFSSYSHVRGDTTTLLASDVMQTIVTRNGRLLVATMGGGMQEGVNWKLKGGKLRFRYLPQFTADEGNVLDMVEADDGYVWVVRETTIDRYNAETGQLLQVGRNDLADRTELTEAQPVFDVLTGRVAIGAVGGFVVFSPQLLKGTTHVPRIAFTNVRFHGEQTEQALLNSGKLYVGSDQRNLTIRFAALDYQSNDLVSYAYRLEGVDEEWNYVGRSHEASFTHLPPGTHQLMVRSTNSDGVWQDNVATLVIEVEPTFWESWMGTVLKVLAVLLVVVVAFFLFRMRQQIRLERRMNRMKTDFYEDVSQQLREPLAMMNDPAAGEMLAIVDEKMSEYELTPPEIIDEDKRMMEQLMAYLDEHIGDSELKIEDLAAAVNLGRSVFYGKVKAMTNMAPVDFVRHLRLKRATDLLERSQYPISQIAYMVGFTDPKYFTKCFKKETGLTPSEYREKQ